MSGWMWALVVVLGVGVSMMLRGRVRRGHDQGGAVRAAVDPLRADSRMPKEYSPKNVGNDASARPWEEAAIAPELHAVAGDDLSAGWLPDGFDAEAFLRASKSNFMSLQDAWDRADVASLRAMMTDGMLQEIQSQLAQREKERPGAVSKTDILMLDAQLLGVEDHDQEYVASVEFSGMSREADAGGPSPFREVWNITRPKSSDGGWLVAGVQAMQ